jgi:hypothetical protein
MNISGPYNDKRDAAKILRKKRKTRMKISYLKLVKSYIYYMGVL